MQTPLDSPIHVSQSWPEGEYLQGWKKFSLIEHASLSLFVRTANHSYQSNSDDIQDHWEQHY